jgi:GTP-binding protein HflX
MAGTWLLGTRTGDTAQRPKAVLVAVRGAGDTAESGSGSELSLTELRRLADTNGLAVVEAVVQSRPRPDSATYVGSGKVDELATAAEQSGADLVIADGELTPGQVRNLEDRVGVGVGSSTTPRSFWTSSPNTPGPAKAACRWSWPRSPTSCCGCAAMAGRCRGSVAAGSPAAPAWVCEARAKCVWRPSGAGYGSGPPSYGSACRSWRAWRERTRRAAHATGCRRSRSPGNQRGKVGATQSADRSPRPRSGCPVRHPRSDGPSDPDRRPGRHPHRHRRLRPLPAAPTGRRLSVNLGRGQPRRPGSARRWRVGPRRVQPDRHVHSVLDEIGAGDVPELLMLNKVDIASLERVTALRKAYPEAVAISVLTGEGIGELRAALAE